MNKKELLAYLLENNTNFSIHEALIGSGLAVLLSFYLFFVYKKTNDSVKYSKSFNITLIMTSIITTMVMMIIGSNLALSLGMVGALSIIRFRAAIKDPKDIAFIFWAVTIGLSCGSGLYIIGIIGSIVLSVILFSFKFGNADKNIYLVAVNIDLEEDSTNIEKVILTLAKKCDVKMTNFKSSGADITYEVKIGSEKVSELSKKLSELPTVKNVSIVSFEGN